MEAHGAPSDQRETRVDLPVRADQQARVDGPHDASRRHADTHAHRVATAAGGASAAVGQAEGATPLAPESSEPALRQARELAERLKCEREDLDRRLALVGSQEAEVEAKQQTARHWIEEQRRELDSREQALAQREAQLSSGAASPAQRKQLDSRAAELDQRQAELYKQVEKLAHDRSRCDAELRRQADRETQLSALEDALAEDRRRLEKDQQDLALQRAELAELKDEIDRDSNDLSRREAQLAVRRQELETALRRFESISKAEAEIAKMRDAAAKFGARSRYLEEAEELLAKDGEALAAERRELQAQRQRFAEQTERERRALASFESAQRREAGQQREQIRARQEELDQREAALEAMQAELLGTQREVLEMRLATEETWAQLTGVLAPASLARSISQVRNQLTDHFQHLLSDLAERRRDLEKAGRTLEERQGTLERRRAELAAWAKRNEEDLERRATQLAEREAELDRQQQQYEGLELRWSNERGEYRQQIRQLLAELRSDTLKAAA